MAELNNRPAPSTRGLIDLKIAPEEFFVGHPQYKPMPDRPDFFECRSSSVGRARRRLVLHAGSEHSRRLRNA